MHSPKARAAAEMSTEDLREEFLHNCELMEKKAHNILTARQDNGADDQTKELQYKIRQLESELTRKQKRRNNLLRQVRNFKAISSGATTGRARAAATASLRGSNTRPKSRSGVIKLLTEYNQKYGDPNVDIALLILKGEADGNKLKELVDMDDESTGFRELIDRRIIQDKYKSQIKELAQDIDNLNEEYHELASRQDDVLASYQKELAQKNETEREYDRLYEQLASKEREAKQAEDIEEQIQNLKDQIDLQQENTNAVSERIAKRQEAAAMARLQKEIDAIMQENKQLEEENKDLEAKLEEAEKESAEAREKATKAKSENIDKSQALELALEKIRQESNSDPFVNSKFDAFITQMEAHGLSPRDVEEKTAEKTKLEEEIKALQNEIEEYEKKEKDLHASIEPKKEQIQQLEASLKTLASRLDMPAAEEEHAMPQFTQGAPNIKFNKSDVSKLAPDETAIAVLFKDFQFERSFIGKKPSKIFLVVDLLEHQSMATAAVDINSGAFDARLTFVCTNDFFLSEFLERTSAGVQLCRQRESQVTEAARTELNMLPFVRGYTSMTQTVALWNKANKVVGKVTFEAAIYRAPVGSKSEE